MSAGEPWSEPREDSNAEAVKGLGDASVKLVDTINTLKIERDKLLLQIGVMATTQDSLAARLKESDRLLSEQQKRVDGILLKWINADRVLLCIDDMAMDMLLKIRQEILDSQETGKRKVTPQNCGCGIDSCLLEFHRADCPLRLPVPPPLTVDTVVPDGKCWLCGRAATGKKGAEPRCDAHL